MLIDDFLPVYDATERHRIDIRAPAEQVYAAVQTLDLGHSPIVRWLFLLRGLPAFWLSRQKPKQPLGLTMDRLLKSGFIVLGARPPQELVLGLVGRFWTAHGDIQQLDAAGFRSFDRPGYAKAVWNFSLTELADGLTRLHTETRVLCLDEASRWQFRLYWLFIRPFSGLIRREALHAIKRSVEAQPTGVQ
jgi:hypothetical protein